MIGLLDPCGAIERRAKPIDHALSKNRQDMVIGQNGWCDHSEHQKRQSQAIQETDDVRGGGIETCAGLREERECHMARPSCAVVSVL